MTVAQQSDDFIALPTKYFLAERATTLPSSKALSHSTVGVARSPSTDAFKRNLESELQAVLARELPRQGRRDEARSTLRRACHVPAPCRVLDEHHTAGRECPAFAVAGLDLELAIKDQHELTAWRWVWLGVA